MIKKKTPNDDIQYTKDESGHDVILKGGMQVEMEWEKPYIEASIDALKPSGDVLEIGFGLGYAANAIQKYHPSSHTIVENNPSIIAKAKEWAKKHTNVTVVEGFWQDKLKDLGIFDAIYFNDYIPIDPNQVREFAQSSPEYKEKIMDSFPLQDFLEEALEQFRGIKFSDADVRAFGKHVLERRGVSSKTILNFMDRLERWGNITASQRDAFVKEFGKLIKAVHPVELSETSWLQVKEFPGDRFVFFIEEGLKKHMKKGSRLSAYIGPPESKSRHEGFKERILSRKDLKYTEKSIAVKVPPNCSFYKGNQALIIVIEKK